MKRRALSLALAVLMIFTLLPVSAFAEGEPCTHENWQKIDEKAADCGRDGNEEYYHCPDCGAASEDSSFDVIETVEHFKRAATGDHSYTDAVTPPTCVDQGYTTHTCSVCGDSNKDNYTDATGVHDFVNNVCTVCGARLKLYSMLFVDGTPAGECLAGEPLAVTVYLEDTSEEELPIVGKTITASIGGTQVATGTTNLEGKATLQIPTNNPANNVVCTFAFAGDEEYYGNSNNCYIEFSVVPFDAVYVMEQLLECGEYGYELDRDLTLAAGDELVVEEDQRLSLADGVTLTVPAGTSLENNGWISLMEGSAINVTGTYHSIWVNLEFYSDGNAANDAARLAGIGKGKVQYHIEADSAAAAAALFSGRDEAWGEYSVDASGSFNYIDSDLTVPEGNSLVFHHSFTVNEGKTLTIAEGAQLWLNNWMGEELTLQNDGILMIEGQVFCYATVVNNGTIYAYGDIQPEDINVTGEGEVITERPADPVACGENTVRSEHRYKFTAEDEGWYCFEGEGEEFNCLYYEQGGNEERAWDGYVTLYLQKDEEIVLNLFSFDWQSHDGYKLTISLVDPADIEDWAAETLNAPSVGDIRVDFALSFSAFPCEEENEYQYGILYGKKSALSENFEGGYSWYDEAAQMQRSEGGTFPADNQTATFFGIGTLPGTTYVYQAFINFYNEDTDNWETRFGALKELTTEGSIANIFEPVAEGDTSLTEPAEYFVFTVPAESAELFEVSIGGNAYAGVLDECGREIYGPGEYGGDIYLPGVSGAKYYIYTELYDDSAVLTIEGMAPTALIQGENTGLAFNDLYKFTAEEEAEYKLATADSVQIFDTIWWMRPELPVTAGLEDGQTVYLWLSDSEESGETGSLMISRINTEIRSMDDLKAAMTEGGTWFYVMEDLTIDEDITIPEDTTLHIASWVDDDTDEIDHRQVTINEGVTVTVKGRLQVGGFSTLTNNGTIVADGGEIIVYGTLADNGVIDWENGYVETSDGAKIIEGQTLRIGENTVISGLYYPFKASADGWYCFEGGGEGFAGILYERGDYFDNVNRNAVALELKKGETALIQLRTFDWFLGSEFSLRVSSVSPSTISGWKVETLEPPSVGDVGADLAVKYSTKGMQDYWVGICYGVKDVLSADFAGESDWADERAFTFCLEDYATCPAKDQQISFFGVGTLPGTTYYCQAYVSYWDTNGNYVTRYGELKEFTTGGTKEENFTEVYTGETELSEPFGTFRFEVTDENTEDFYAFSVNGNGAVTVMAEDGRTFWPSDSGVVLVPAKNPAAYYVFTDVWGEDGALLIIRPVTATASLATGENPDLEFETMYSFQPSCGNWYSIGTDDSLMYYSDYAGNWQWIESGYSTEVYLDDENVTCFWLEKSDESGATGRVNITPTTLFPGENENIQDGLTYYFYPNSGPDNNDWYCFTVSGENLEGFWYNVNGGGWIWKGEDYFFEVPLCGYDTVNVYLYASTNNGQNSFNITIEKEFYSAEIIPAGEESGAIRSTGADLSVKYTATGSPYSEVNYTYGVRYVTSALYEEYGCPEDLRDIPGVQGGVDEDGQVSCENQEVTFENLPVIPGTRYYCQAFIDYTDRYGWWITNPCGGWEFETPAEEFSELTEGESRVLEGPTNFQFTVPEGDAEYYRIRLNGKGTICVMDAYGVEMGSLTNGDYTVFGESGDAFYIYTDVQNGDGTELSIRGENAQTLSAGANTGAAAGEVYRFDVTDNHAYTISAPGGFSSYAYPGWNWFDDSHYFMTGEGDTIYLVPAANTTITVKANAPWMIFNFSELKEAVAEAKGLTDYRMYWIMEDLDISASITIPKYMDLYITHQVDVDGVKLRTVRLVNGATLNVAGFLQISGASTLQVVKGSITVAAGGTIHNYGTILLGGTKMTVNGSLAVGGSGAVKIGRGSIICGKTGDIYDMDVPGEVCSDAITGKISYVLNGGILEGYQKGNRWYTYPTAFRYGEEFNLSEEHPVDRENGYAISVSREGYTFAGWYTDATFKKPITVIPADRLSGITLYAKWTPNKYTVQFDGNGATSGTMKNLSMTYNKTAALTANAFKKTGYTFAGWNTQADGNGTAYANKEKVLNLTDAENGEVKLYAVWTPVSYKITYKNTVPGDGNVNPEAYTVEDAFTLARPEDAHRAECRFEGWFLDAKFTKPVEAIAAGTTGNLTVYAKWTGAGKKYTVNFVGGEGTTGATKPVSTTAGKLITLTANAFKKTGYTFAGWSLAEGGASADFANKAKTSFSGAEDVTLYAVWTPTVYKITYKNTVPSDNNTNEMLHATYTIEDAFVFDTALTRNSGETMRWYSDSRCTKEIAGIDPGTTGNKTVYAKWSGAAAAYTVSFEGGEDATGKTKPVNATAGKLIALTANAFKKTGYTFIGWSEDPNATEPTCLNKAKTSFAGYENVVLYPVWRANAYTIKYSANGGTGKMDNTAAAYGSNAALAKCAFEKAGLDFLGWSTTAKGEAVYADEAEVLNLSEKDKGTVTLYAVWGDLD